MNHHKSKTGVKTRLKEVSNGLTTSKQLLKVLNHIWAYQDPDPSRSFVISALKMELDRARTQVDQLIKEQRLNRNKIEDLLKGFAEEKAEWRRKERDRIRDRVSCIASNLEVEKKLRKQTERVNKKLGKELSDTKALLSSALKEVERERRAKEIFEQVCDELARNIGEDRAQVEEVKKEIEKEREMLHLADLLREERVQMKLMEAKYHFEEKNEAVEMLKDELENYLRRTHLEKSGGHDHDHEGNEIEESPKFEKIKELEDYLRKINFGSSHILEKKGEEAEGEVSDDSDDGDLHSIELNMDNISKGYKWSFAFRNGNGNDQDDSKRSSVEVFRGRRSLSEKIQWGSVCLNRGTGSNSTTNNNGDVQNQQNSSDGFDWERFSELLSQMQTREEEDNQIQINRSSTKCLKDNMFSSPKVSSPTLQNG